VCAAGAILVAASFASQPPQTTGDVPTLLSGAQVDANVLSILRRSCQDCHSELTHFPWYSYVAPVSFLVRSDVEGARKHLNLSRWADYPLARKERSLSEIANQVKDRDMPLWQYTLIHRNASLSDADIDAVFRWTQAERARLIASSAAPR
jgi:Haem-binding domain